MGLAGRSQPSSLSQSGNRNSPKPVRSTRLRNCLGMIWSVSTSARSSTLTPPETMRIGSMSATSAGGPGPDVDETALDGGCGGHLGRDEVGAPAAALAPLEVAVRRGGAALARAQDVRVHAQAHRAAGRAPVEPGRGEDVVEALPLGLRGDLLGARHDHRVDARRDAAA